MFKVPRNRLMTHPLNAKKEKNEGRIEGRMDLLVKELMQPSTCKNMPYVFIVYRVQKNF